MSEHIEQTSASDRHAAAREALDRLSRMPLRHEVVLIDEPVRRHAYIKGYEIAVEEMRAELDTLRALITPPNVHESEHDMVMEIARAYYPHARGTAYEAAARGVRAGIQYAHERWEPADRPSQEQMLRWLGIEHELDRSVGMLYIREQYIERED